jgi:hypothetical protein
VIIVIHFHSQILCCCMCVTRERPTFVERLSSSILRPGRSILEPLNMGQRRAVLKAVTANDYFLIKGMPGTGELNF